MVEGNEENVLMSENPFQDRTIQEMESEIRYLRHLLDANGIAYDYQAYRDALAAKFGTGA